MTARTRLSRMSLQGLTCLRGRLENRVSAMDVLVPWPALLASLRQSVAQVDAEIRRRPIQAPRKGPQPGPKRAKRRDQ